MPVEKRFKGGFVQFREKLPGKRPSPWCYSVHSFGENTATLHGEGDEKKIVPMRGDSLVIGKKLIGPEGWWH